MGKELFFSKILSFLLLVLNGHCGRNLFFSPDGTIDSYFHKINCASHQKKTFLMEDRERGGERKNLLSNETKTTIQTKTMVFTQMEKVK